MISEQQAHEAIETAQRHAKNPLYPASADKAGHHATTAKMLFKEGYWYTSTFECLRSLAVTVGTTHPDYVKYRVLFHDGAFVYMQRTAS